MNTKNLIGFSLLAFTFIMIVITSLDQRDKTIFLSPRHCCTLEVQKVDDTVSLVIYRNNRDYDGFEEYILNDRLDAFIGRMADYCDAHHPEL